MKFIHISDLHLGKRLNEFSMLEDQKYILKQIVKICADEQVQGVLLAGDVYDKPIPPAEAVKLLDEFLTELSAMGISIFAISGNHDSAERLAFGAGLMQKQKVYLSPVYDGSVTKITKQDEYGKINIFLLPFLKAVTVRHALKRDDLNTCQEAIAAVIDKLKQDEELNSTERNIILSHQFVTGSSQCDSEEVSVGGLDNIEASVFADFDYAALGHIHSPQSITRETVRYCGTPLKYSFSEAKQEKSVTVLNFKEKGNIEMKLIALQPLRDLRVIKGDFETVTAADFEPDLSKKDYVQVILTDEDDILDGLVRLRAVYPNLMRLEYDNKRTRETKQIEAMPAVEQKSEEEIFAEFFEKQNNQEMKEEQKAFVRKLIERLKEE